VIASSEEYPGASVLVTKSCLAALRTGADLVTVAAPSNVGWVMHKYSPDLIIKKYPCRYFDESHVKEISELSKKADVVVMGSGLGMDSAGFVREFVKKHLRNQKSKLVLDADALKAIKINKVKNAILTPHSTEFRLVTGEKLPKLLKSKIKLLKKISKENKTNVILLKGNPDIIAYNGKVKINETGNQGMTVGGTGDVLAGLCAGILAQAKQSRANKPIYYLDLFNSACAAAFVNGLVGDKLKKKLGYGFIGSDMLKEIGKAIKALS